MSDLRCIGVDVYLVTGEIPKIPEKVAGLTLDSISSRGLKVGPGPAPVGMTVHWYQCRFLERSGLSDDQIQKLLVEISKLASWEKVQKLFERNGKDQFSKGHG